MVPLSFWSHQISSVVPCDSRMNCPPSTTISNKVTDAAPTETKNGLKSPGKTVQAARVDVGLVGHSQADMVAPESDGPGDVQPDVFNQEGIEGGCTGEAKLLLLCGYNRSLQNFLRENG